MERPSHLVLASQELERAVEPLGLQRVLFVPTAANGLDDREDVVRTYRSQLEVLDLELIDWDLEDVSTRGEVPTVDAICCSGGDPYRLLAACRASGFDKVITALVATGVTYIGASAGALVAGPTLDPIEHVSPFPRPDGVDLRGLVLTSRVVLPHDDRPGRREAHAAAQTQHGAVHRMLAITDGETVTIRDEAWVLADHAAGHTIRPATLADASEIAECYAAAARAAWDFVDAERLAAMPPPVAGWRDRLRSAPDADDVLVVEDADGLGGFVWVRRALDADLDDGVGEVGAFYTHPRLWGRGAGRRLLGLALDRLRAMQCESAVLYTEERNARPRQMYERLGWRLDGASRDREFLGQPIRELRHRISL